MRWIDSAQRPHSVQGHTVDVPLCGAGVVVPVQIQPDRELKIILNGVEVLGRGRDKLSAPIRIRLQGWPVLQAETLEAEHTGSGRDSLAAVIAESDCNRTGLGEPLPGQRGRVPTALSDTPTFVRSYAWTWLGRSRMYVNIQRVPVVAESPMKTIGVRPFRVQSLRLLPA
jgi:hypothetical protein